MPFENTREVTDPRAMRALAHPVRIALLELLALEGTLTATQAAERVGESPSNCSFHLRQLAKYGFVEEAGGGPGRQRPWRRLGEGLRLERFHADTETTVAASQLERTFVNRYLDGLRTWYATRDAYPVGWQKEAAASESLAYLTLDELRSLNQELAAVLDRLPKRLDNDRRPPGALPVEVLLFSYPKRPPGGEG